MSVSKLKKKKTRELINVFGGVQNCFIISKTDWVGMKSSYNKALGNTKNKINEKEYFTRL